MAKHLIDLDEDKVRAARAELGTTAIKATVNAAPRRASRDRERRVERALDVLGRVDLRDRAGAWR